MRVFRVVSILFYLLIVARGLAQENNVWVFGRNAGLDFNTTPPTSIQTSINSREACTSISDDNGNMLFYTDGSNIWNKNDVLMNGGSSIFSFGCTQFSATESTRQGAVIVPYPGQSRRYLVFSLTSWECISILGYASLYYTVIDMNLNGGLGDVVPGQTAIHISSDPLLTECMAAVAGDNCNFWLMTMFSEAADSISFKAFEISDAGINSAPVVSKLVAPPNFRIQGGRIVFSPDRKMLAFSNTYNYSSGIAPGSMELYTFNPSTGNVSSLASLSQGFTGGTAFSSDNSKLYVSHFQEICQYRLNVPAGSISGTRTLVAPNVNGTVDMKLGPDNKIYIEADNSIAFSVINKPNLSGSLCDYQPNVIALSANTRIRDALPSPAPKAVPSDTVFSTQTIPPSCFASAVTLSPSSTVGRDYTWSTGDTGESLVVDTTGVYWVKYLTSTCKLFIDTFRVSFTEETLPIIFRTPECRSDSNGSAYVTTYLGDPVNYSYTWLHENDTLSFSDTLSGVSAGPYSLYVSTDTGCDTLLYFDIPEADFRVSFEVSDTISCLGDALQFQNTSDTHFTAFHWALGNRDSYSLPGLQDYRYSEPGAYRVLLAGEGEICKDTAYQTIVVDQPISPYYDVEPGAVCVGQSVHFRPHTDSTTTQLQWNVVGQARVEAWVERQYQHAFEQPGIFPVTLGVHSRACPDTSYTDSIRVYALPEVDLGGDTAICLDGAPVYLKNLREAPLNPYHQVWSTGDMTDVLKVVHPGIYALSVTAGPIGCTTTESIEISKDCYVDIPNAFTPNGDGSNDYFLPRQLLSESLSRFRMQVFNRWGQMVFETNRIDGRGWDGRFNDKVQPTGVYLYRIEADFINGRKEQYEGNVTLLR